KGEELSGDTGGQVNGFAYCKKCDVPTTGKVVGRELPDMYLAEQEGVIIGGQRLKCVGVAYLNVVQGVQGFDDDKSFNNFAEFNNISNANTLLFALLEDPKVVECSGYLKDQLGDWDYCNSLPTEEVIEI